MPTRKTQNNTSFKRGITPQRYDRQYSDKTVSTLKEVIRKIENGVFQVESFGWWQEGTVDKFTFQIHVKESQS